MRVAFTCPYSLRRVTGIGVFLADLLRSLPARGHEGWVICPDGHGTLLEEIPKNPAGVSEVHIESWPLLKDFVLGFGTAIVLVRRRHDYEVIHAQQPHLQTLVAIVVGRACGRKVVTTLHGRLPRPTDPIRLRFLRFLEWFVLRFSGEVAYVSEQTKSDFGFARGKAIPNGADQERFKFDADARRRARREIGIGDEFVVLFLSRWAALKGIREALDAFAQVAATHRRLRLLLVGGGLPEEEAFVQRHVKELGIETVTISLGVADRKPWFFQAADLYMLPSRTEGLPLALLEAMSVGLPCVVTPVGGMHDVIQDGVNGLAVPVGNADALARAISRCVDDASMREAVGRRARETVIERYSLEHMVGEYVRTYEALAERAKSRSKTV